MSDGPNESQRLIAETLDGTIVVDAGPGTGKTETIVTRYVNLIARKDVEPKDVLLLTFTNNAANEMEERIKERLSDRQALLETYPEEVVERLRERSKHVQVKTFDAFCLSVIMDSPEDAGALFGIDERLTRGATIVTNESLNREHFRSYLDRFLNDRLGDYGDWAAIASQYPVGLFNLINRLMSRGVYPMARGWFGMDVWGQLLGDTNALLETMEERNVIGKRGGASPMASAIAKLDVNDVCSPPPIVDKTVPGEYLTEAANDDGRREMLGLVHDVYHGYVRKCVSEDRLTFGINAMLAFSLLYGDAGVRERNSYRFVMIDEFQDTNAGQLMIALMILREPNLCVVGDWKQGIYGFRFVSIDNIIDFDARAAALREFLNQDQTRVRVRLPEKAVEVRLEYNYRSSGAIIDKAFECMELEGKDRDVIDPALLSRVSLIKPGRSDIPDEHTYIRYVRCDSVESEAEEVVRCVRDYVDSGRYVVHSRDSSRPMGYGDIAVLCRKTSHCRNVLEALRDAGIPAFLQGDMEIMSTREGKLALAWLRYISNDDDAWGYMPILADMGYSLSECLSMRGKSYMLPTEMQMMRKDLRQKTRRVTQLLSEIYGFYGLNNEITQAIITTLSTAHRDSLITIADLIRIIEENQLYLLDRPDGERLYASRYGLRRDANEAFTSQTSVDDKARTSTEIDPDNYRVTINAHEGYNVYATNGVHYVVAKENDSFENIGEKFRLSPRNLRRFNDLKNKTAQPLMGEVVYIERKKKRWEGNAQHHICRQGETAYSVGQSYAIRTRSIERMNRLKKDTELDAGRQIRIK